MDKDIDFIKRQAERDNISPRAYCIKQIDHWREMLEKVSEDYRELDREEFELRIELDREE